MSHRTESHFQHNSASGATKNGESSEGSVLASSGEASQFEQLRSVRPISFVKLGMQAFGIAVVGFVGMFGYAWWETKNLELAWPYMNGQRVFALPATVFLGEVPKGTVAGSRIRIVNMGSESTSVLGAQKSCSCITLTEFPLEIPAGSSLEIDFLMTVPDTETAFSHSVRFFTSDFGFATKSVAIAGVSR